MSEGGRKLYIGGISRDYDDEDLKRICEKHGNIDDGMFYKTRWA